MWAHLWKDTAHCSFPGFTHANFLREQTRNALPFCSPTINSPVFPGPPAAVCHFLLHKGWGKGGRRALRYLLWFDAHENNPAVVRMETKFYIVFLLHPLLFIDCLVLARDHAGCFLLFLCQVFDLCNPHEVNIIITILQIQKPRPWGVGGCGRGVDNSCKWQDWVFNPGLTPNPLL